MLAAWPLDPGILAVGAAAGFYLLGLRRPAVRGGRFARARAVAFFGGMAALLVALVPPIGTHEDVLLSVHMVQHLLLWAVACPLILLGAPLTLAMRASSPSTRSRFLVPLMRSRAVRWISHPLVTWALFVGTQYAVHFSPLFQAALEHGFVHGAEHALLLGSGLLFWLPVAGEGVLFRRIGFSARLLYLALAIPAMGLVGLAIVSADSPLYGHYARATVRWGASPLADQALAGAIMWIGGDLTLVVALLITAARWRADDERRELIRAIRRAD